MEQKLLFNQKAQVRRNKRGIKKIARIDTWQSHGGPILLYYMHLTTRKNSTFM